MRRVIVLLVSLSIVAGARPRAQDDRSIPGFDAPGAAAERALEARFDAQLSADNLRAWLERLAARPHHVGSAYGKENAEFMAELFRSWGFETRIERFDVLFPTPTARRVELVSPERYVARLAEPPLDADRTSGQAGEQLPPYNAYSIAGDVTAPLVYVNYGVPADYEELARRGVDVRGKIVIARYGGSWRGIKPKVAAEHGAVGCLIYSDPRDDGYFRGEAYPDGAWRNEWGAQRGSVADMPLFPGDPLTPGVGATPDARRLPVAEAPTLTKIPVLPLAWGDALPLLKALGGPVAPEAWRGALPITYRLGPGPATGRLQAQFDFALAPAFNVIATLSGRERPDQWVIRGNHHDAWVNGAEDPVSGMVALLEEARAVGELAKTGWRPRRTIVYAAWDAEEPGLLGSTEWVEAHADELRRKAVAYVNTDGNGRGFLSAGGSHTLEPLVNTVARDVADPQTGVSVHARLRAARLAGGSAEERREVRERRDLRIAALGSGSDYTPFLQHLGIASLNIGFGGEDGGGSYHSIYDSIDHYARFGDPGFRYGVALAQVAGRLTLRLAEASVLPMRPGALAETVGRYITEVVRLADETRERIAETARLIDERAYELSADPTAPVGAPRRDPAAPHLNLAPLLNAGARLTASASAFEKAIDSEAGRTRLASADAQRALDAVLGQLEQTLTREQGLPRRPWFRHQVYAPGFYTGYGVKTLPGVREAIEERQWAEAEAQAAVLAGVLGRAADAIDAAAALLAPPPGQ